MHKIERKLGLRGSFTLFTRLALPGPLDRVNVISISSIRMLSLAIDAKGILSSAIILLWEKNTRDIRLQKIRNKITVCTPILEAARLPPVSMTSAGYHFERAANNRFDDTKRKCKHADHANH